MNFLDRLFGREEDKTPVAGTTFLVVGLGNPGREYRGNRHNIGFMAIDRLGESYHAQTNRFKNKSMTGDFRLGDHKVVLAKPQTYMNDSGNSVGPLSKFYKVDPENIIVVYDELDLPFGTVRIREKGSAGGHNGMKSIIKHVGPDFPRIRLGIGRPNGKMPVKAYVLQDFGKQDQDVLDLMLDRTVSAIETMIQSGINLAMSRHNGSVVS
ncbi:MAG: aminoacyl-tRNA hydrolase [Chloroflexota bacterium]